MLAGGVGFGVSGALSQDKESLVENPKTGYIDAHAHVWTPDAKQYPLASGFQRENIRPPSFTPKELMDHARPSGVDRVVLIQVSFYGFDNAYMLDAIRDFPGHFSGVAVVDSSVARPQEKMRDLAGNGVRGFRIKPGKSPVNEWLGSDGMAAMWKYAADSGLAICPLIHPPFLPALHEMCTKYPDTTVVIDHFARVGIDGEIRESELTELCRLASFKNTYVKTSAFYALGERKAPYTDLGPMIRRLRNAFGPERLMWATDCPFQVQGGHTFSDSIELIRDRLDFFSEGDREWILRKTAEKVFF